MGKKSNNPNIHKHGFGANPQNINRSGANRGSKWNKNLLRDLLTVDLSKVNNKAFEKMKEMFPEFFDGSKDANWQLFMEIKQLSLILHKDPRVSQAAIKEIKDRIGGKVPNEAIQEEEEQKDISISVTIKGGKVDAVTDEKDIDTNI